MVDVTLLAIHLDGAELTANAPFSGRSSDDADGSTDDAAGDDTAGDESTDDARSGASADAGGPSPIVGLTILAVLVLLVVVVKKLRGGGGSVEEAHDELEDLGEDVGEDVTADD